MCIENESTGKYTCSHAPYTRFTSVSSMNLVSTIGDTQVPKRGPGVRKGKRAQLACRTRCNIKRDFYLDVYTILNRI